MRSSGGTVSFPKNLRSLGLLCSALTCSSLHQRSALNIAQPSGKMCIPGYLSFHSPGYTPKSKRQTWDRGPSVMRGQKLHSYTKAVRTSAFITGCDSHTETSAAPSITEPASSLPLWCEWGKDEERGTPKEGVTCKTKRRATSTTQRCAGQSGGGKAGRWEGDGEARGAGGNACSPRTSASARGGSCPAPQPVPARSPRRLPPAPPLLRPPPRPPPPPPPVDRCALLPRGAGVSTCHRAAAAAAQVLFSGNLPGASCASGSSPWPPPPPPASSPGPPRPPPSPAAAGPDERQQRGLGGWEPRAQPPAPERSCFRAATQRPSGAGALRMRRGAGAGLRALSGVVSAAPRAPARPPPARAPRRGHAVSHVAGDQGDPGGPVQLRHPPHPLRDSLVHLPRCGLRPRHLSAAGPPGRHATRGASAAGGPWGLSGPAVPPAWRWRPPPRAPPPALHRLLALTFSDAPGRAGPLRRWRTLAAVESCVCMHDRCQPGSCGHITLGSQHPQARTAACRDGSLKVTAPPCSEDCPPACQRSFPAGVEGWEDCQSGLRPSPPPITPSAKPSPGSRMGSVTSGAMLASVTSIHPRGPIQPALPTCLAQSVVKFHAPSSCAESEFTGVAMPTGTPVEVLTLITG
uniref:uncharacterized protein LOC128928114 n=1 Tax=Callithrix jacchus TaxID=9483 RepID=UPI0023DD35D6|nr:uncharacterized protein LOC128928114 [Callithrix jacchus]